MEIFPDQQWLETRMCSRPTFFSMMLSTTLPGAFSQGDTGVETRYRTDHMLHNRRRLKETLEVSLTTIRDLNFANDCALDSNCEEQMHHGMNSLGTTCENF